jgi:hypothetical protein
VTAAAVAMVTVIVVGSVAWLSRLYGDAPAVDESPPTTAAVTPTTEAAITTDSVVSTSTTLAAAPVVPPGEGPMLEFVEVELPSGSGMDGSVWFNGALHSYVWDDPSHHLFRSADGVNWEHQQFELDNVGGTVQTDGNRLVSVRGTETHSACLTADDSIWVNTSHDGIEWTTSEIDLLLDPGLLAAGCFTNYETDFAVHPQGIVVTTSVILEAAGGIGQGLVDPDDGIHVEVADIDLERGVVLVRLINESDGDVLDIVEIDGFGQQLTGHPRSCGLRLPPITAHMRA